MTSSKCVGVILKDNKISLVDQKLSPIIQMTSEVTKPKYEPWKELSTDIESYNVYKNTNKIPAKVNENNDNLKPIYTEILACGKIKTKQTYNHKSTDEFITKDILSTVNDNLNSGDVNFDAYKEFLSKSFVQHVYNKERPSNEKLNKISFELMESKLDCKKDKDSRNMFESKSKDKLNTEKPITNSKSASRKFETLRRGFIKTESAIESLIINKPLNSDSKTDHKDDPKLSFDVVNSKYVDVQGKLEINSKKFTFDEVNSNKSHTILKDVTKHPIHGSCQKKRKRFFFFRKKIKCKANKQCKAKKGSSIEVKVGVFNDQPIKEKVSEPENVAKDCEALLSKAWLENFKTNARDSRNSVHLRWNNKMYTTSSSTVLELVENVHKRTEIDLTSHSKIATGELSDNNLYRKQRVRFLQQYVQTWMIPHMMTEKQISVRGISNHQWFNKTSKELPCLVLLYSKPDNKSSQYVVIRPESLPSSTKLTNQSSDEEIYKIVEYETPESKKVKLLRSATEGTVKKIKKGSVAVQADERKNDHKTKKLRVIAKNPPLRREVAIQDSKVFLPKKGDVIEVGIITQKEMRGRKKPILKLEPELPDEESVKDMSIQKKCELAESFLQDYYRAWMPSATDLLSWHPSSSELQSSEQNSTPQGNSEKYCTNVYNDFQPTIVLSSCETSSCSHCYSKAVFEDDTTQDESSKYKILSRFLKKSLKEPQTRHAPKDSLEVFKKRMYYSSSKKKSKWKNIDSSTKRNESRKHVLFPGCEEMNLPPKLSNRSLEGILSYKGSGCYQKGSPQHIESITKPACPIPKFPCKECRLTDEKSTCTEKNSPCCDENTSCEFTPLCGKPITSPPDEIPICSKQKKTHCKSLCKDVTEQSSKKYLPSSNRPSREFGISLKINPSPNSSHESIRKKNKDCLAHCACNKKKLSRKLTEPPPPPLNVPNDCPGNKQKVSGVYLKKIPCKKKTCSGLNDQKDLGIIRLNSTEKITIRLKNETPSTGNINESLNIKVQDEDGQTLYERIDYKQSGKVIESDSNKDMSKGHQIQRVSTPRVAHDTEVRESKSDTCIDNLIEINFRLKLKQGDKGTTVEIENNSDRENKHNEEVQLNESNLVQDQTNHLLLADTKNDVNIKIVIRNHNTDNEKEIVNKTRTDNFAQRISKKFQAVSTAYSDILDHNSYSVHRPHTATLNLTTSTDQIMSEPYKCKIYQLTENDFRPCNKAVKNGMLRKPLKSLSLVKKLKKKKKHEEIVRTTLSSDCKQNEDMAATSNKMAKELTYAALNPKCFRHTDSMNHQLDSALSVHKENENKKPCPTKTNNGMNKNESAEYGKNKFKAYSCSACETKLKTTARDEYGCRKSMQDAETGYDSRFDVTQYSNNISSEMNCTNFQRNAQSFIISTASVTLEKSINKDHITPEDTNKYITTLPQDVSMKSCGLNQLNEETSLSHDEILSLSENFVEESKSRTYNKKKILKAESGKKDSADILQLSEMKRGVLEIYAEKIISKEGERIVAKLPKFVMKENYITEYDTKSW